MSGPQLAEHLPELRPEMKMVFISGYTELTMVEEFLRDTESVFLAKPFRVHQLLATIRDVLQNRNPGPVTTPTPPVDEVTTPA
jgi:FixJ family two-component response regulator